MRLPPISFIRGGTSVYVEKGTSLGKLGEPAINTVSLPCKRSPIIIIPFLNVLICRFPAFRSLAIWQITTTRVVPARRHSEQANFSWRSEREGGGTYCKPENSLPNLCICLGSILFRSWGYFCTQGIQSRPLCTLFWRVQIVIFWTEFRGPLTQCKRLGFLLLLSKIVYLEWPLIPPRTILNIIKMVPDYLVS